MRWQARHEHDFLNLFEPNNHSNITSLISSNSNNRHYHYPSHVVLITIVTTTHFLSYHLSIYILFIPSRLHVTTIIIHRTSQRERYFEPYTTNMSSFLCIFFIIFLATTSTTSVQSARQFHVGDHFGWRQPDQNNADFYTKWARINRFQIGDSLGILDE